MGGKRAGRMIAAAPTRRPPAHPMKPKQVEQFDTLIPSLTVEEMFSYTAQLKRPLGESMRDKREAVEELLQKLGLTDCRRVKIGGSAAEIRVGWMADFLLCAVRVQFWRPV